VSGISESLRARIRALEGGGAGLGREVVPLGLAAIDRALPWGGLPRRSLHELGGRAAAGAAALFAGRLAQARGAVVWIHRARSGQILHAPGLARFGLDPRRLLLVLARDDRDAAWALEEALRSPAVACAVAELARLDLTLSRRLQLAAEEGGGTGLVLRPGPPDLAANAALGRWRVEPQALPGPRRWSLSLWRCRGGAPAVWTLRLDSDREPAVATENLPLSAPDAGAARGA
jgi:protein ImuA